METKISMIEVIIKDDDCAKAVNTILCSYEHFVIGKMQIPYREKNVSIVCIVLDCDSDTLGAIAGKIGSLKCVIAKAVSVAV